MERGILETKQSTILKFVISTKNYFLKISQGGGTAIDVYNYIQDESPSMLTPMFSFNN